MKLRNALPVIILSLLLPLLNASAQIKPERQWPGYRGYLASGVLDNASLPETFDFQKGVNILWKVNIPGMGISSPSIWNNRLFITTAVSEGDKAGFKPGLYGDVTPVKDSSIHEWKVYCLDKRTGKVIWEKTAFRGVPKVKRHPKSTHANSTIATDGKHVVAFFGSEGLYCYDFNGKLLWQKNFGLLRSAFFVMKNAEWEFASSPLIYNGVVVVQCDVLENSFLGTYDTDTGKELWKVSRDEYPGWCTPNIYTNAGNTCIAVNGFKHRGGYDFKTGKEIWKMSGGGDIPIPTPINGNGVIFFNSAHGKSSPIMAVKAGASGDITLKENETSNSGVLWSMPRGGSYIQTMLLYRNRLYSLNWNGTLQCLDPLTGKEVFNGKLGASKSFMASPVASDGKIYIIDETGTVYVLQDGDTFKLLAEIPTGEISLTAPAITDGIIFFRTQNSLYAVGKK